MNTDTGYRSYLLRLRRSGKPNDDGGVWRITLEEAGSGQETVFPTLDALLIYLTAQLGRSDSQ